MVSFIIGQIRKNRRIIKFLISGGLVTLVGLTSLYLLTDVLRIWYLFSAVLSFVVCFFISFYLQKFWTFADNSRSKIYRQLSLYLLVALINLFFNLAALYFLVDILKIWYMPAQIIVYGLIAASNFLIYKFVIFKTEPKPL